MIKNAKGITLVELLVALTLSFVILGLLYGILQMGIKAYDTDTDVNDLQTDANIVLETLSNKFYKDQCTSFGQELTPVNGKVYLSDGKTLISNPLFNYTGSITCENNDLLTINLTVTYKNQKEQIKTSLYYPWTVNQ